MMALLKNNLPHLIKDPYDLYKRAGFVGMRGKKDSLEDGNNLLVNKRAGFVGMRGKKMAEDNEDGFALSKRAGFVGMRGKKWSFWSPRDVKPNISVKLIFNELETTGISPGSNAPTLAIDDSKLQIYGISWQQRRQLRHEQDETGGIRRNEGLSLGRGASARPTLIS